MVSVIIPSYNYGRFLPDAIRSVQAQSHADFECIVVDNGSTDNTPEVIAPFLKDPRIHYIRQENLGVSAGRNAGLRKATGDYIVFLDADDLLEREKLAASVTYLINNPECDLVYTDMRYFRNEEPERLYHGFNCDPGNDVPWMSYQSGSGQSLVSKLLEGNIMVISSPMFRRQALEKTGWFDERLNYNEDWDLWLRFALADCQINYLQAPATLALIRIHRASASVNVVRMQVCGLAVLLKNSDAIKAAGLNEKLQQRIAAHRTAILQSLLASDGPSFAATIAYIKSLNLYHEILKRDLKRGLLSKLYLRYQLMFGK